MQLMGLAERSRRTQLHARSCLRRHGGKVTKKRTLVDAICSLQCIGEHIAGKGDAFTADADMFGKADGIGHGAVSAFEVVVRHGARQLAGKRAALRSRGDGAVKHAGQGVGRLA